MLVSIEGVRWALCTGVYGARLIISLRSTDRAAEAGELLRRVVGEASRAGGHGMVAGGSVELPPEREAEAAVRELTGRFLEAVGRDADDELKPLLEGPAPAGGTGPQPMEGGPR